MKDIYFLFLLVLTGVGSSIMTLYTPTMVAHIKRLFTRKKRTFDTPYPVMQLQIQALQKQMDELKEQMNNVAQNSYRREQNRKSNIRRTVREYLSELKND